MKTSGLLLGILCLSALACATPPATPGTPAQTTKYRVSPPDVLQISVRPAPEINRTVIVRPDGRISFDLIGEVVVEGKTVEEIQREITARIEQFIVHPDVTVVLKNSNSRRYYIFGEVKKPGAYALIGHVTALEALGSAGGPTRFASLGSARLVRPSEGKGLRYAVNFKQISRYGDSATNYELQPGDVIYVPPTLSARIGYAIGVIFFPIQQILGLGGKATNVIL
jgi:polysaccharide export outer membrane protein